MTGSARVAARFTAATFVCIAVACAWTALSRHTEALGQDESELLVTGEALYMRDCAWCHGTQGQGTSYGPSLVGVGALSADFNLSTGRMPLRPGQTQAVRKPPAYTRDEIAALVAYVASFGAGPPIPSVDLSAGSLREGAILYEQNCAACHSSPASGAALTGGQQAPGLAASTPVEIAEAIRLGPGTMPVFGPDTISETQLNSLVRYANYLRHPDDRGGAPLGHYGPISEGFVAWVFALGVVLLVVRWIGKSANEP